MQQKFILTTIFIASLLLSVSPAFADVYIQPAKLGIVRLTVQPLFPTISQGTFVVGDTYNYSLNVTLLPTQNISSIITLSDTNFTLHPNENRTVSYTIKPTAPGVFQGGIVLKFESSASKASVGYENEIIIIVSKSNSYVFVLAAVAAVAVIIAASVIVMKKGRKVKKHA